MHTHHLMLAMLVVAVVLVGADHVNGAGESHLIDDFTGDSGDGHLIKSGAVYNTVWTASSSDSAVTATTYLYLGQRFSVGTYYIYRAAVYFDTSSIPDHRNVTHAWLELSIYQDYSDSDFYVVAQIDGESPSVPLVVGDYDKSLYSGNERYLSTSGISTDTPYTIPLDPALINVTSTTRIMLRSSRDVDGTTPSGNEYLRVHATEEASGLLGPKLTVVYDSDYAVMATNESASDDGATYYQDPDYSTAWNAASGTPVTTSDTVPVGNRDYGVDYLIYRGAMYIDTDGLPDDLNLSLYNATLLVYISAIYNDNEFTVYVQDGQPTYPHTPLVAGDYAKSNYLGGLSLGNLNNTTTLSQGNWYPIPVNTSVIDLDGVTKLCLRTDWDIYGADYGNNNQYLHIIGDEVPYHAYRLILTAVPEVPDPEPEPGPDDDQDEGETINALWWEETCSSTLLLGIVLVVIALGVAAMIITRL